MNSFTKKLSFALFLLLLISITWMQSWVFIPTPEIEDISIINDKVDTLGHNRYRIKNNFIIKKQDKIWELYTEGTPFEIGYSTGALSKSFLQEQEAIFAYRMVEHAPGKHPDLARLLSAFYNRHMDNRILPEYCREMYGVSFHMNPEFDNMGSPYQRILNYHGIYDTQHSFEKMDVKVNSAFAINGSKTKDHDILIGRNFDFFLHDQHRTDKIVHFVKPEEGFKFASISWAGFIGAVSGMNETGLTVTINTAESQVPLAATMPMSLIAREILQYAQTVDEAFNIAFTKEAYVNESILISSAFDTTAIIIEKTPHGIDSIQMRNNELVCTSHLQTDDLRKPMAYDPSYASYYRAIRIQELIHQQDEFTVQDIAGILRDTDGFEDQPIGLGNAKSINSLHLHHSIIFKPETREMWLSTSHHGMEEFICYNLDSVFQSAQNFPPPRTLASETRQISEASPEHWEIYHNYKQFKGMAFQFKNWNNQLPPISQHAIDEFIALNPKGYNVYEIIGDYYIKAHQSKKAAEFYKKALENEVATHQSRQYIKEKYELVMRD
ncbi:C45 family autoproteolytic acyltransferase/hydolase [Flammeovirga aprica]|uniref:Peptidase C45 hydrolase domain-containing protein n=1 Tax=Flammeovirga aprica JL-4 TaxID=694437 RepID=A0A7X9XA86_9BACT|nr:C45 family peptidase [Flammeovirga aprica]NME69343.1 hypothetical protein [Flammeovirga aprica JL-4]